MGEKIINSIAIVLFTAFLMAVTAFCTYRYIMLAQSVEVNGNTAYVTVFNQTEIYDLAD